MTEHPLIVDAVGLSRLFPGGGGVRDLTLQLSEGEFATLLGPSGSGKTSLLMLLAGLERPSGGSIRVAGHMLGGLDEDALARIRRDHIGIVFQAFHLIPTMTAHENVAIGMELAGVADAMDRAAAALRSVGLGHRLSHLPGQLSGGEQQRVALARALAPRPVLILADEPTGNLDQATGAVVIDLLFALTGEMGATLLLVTHDPALAARCGRSVHMADGRVVGA